MPSLTRSGLSFGIALALALSGCGGDDDVANAPTSTSTTSSTTTSTTSAPASFPPAFEELEQGASTWAVVLAGSTDAEAPELQAAIEAAADAGYDTGPTDCDEGAADALGVDGGGTSVLTVSVYFETEEHASQALDAFRSQGVDGAVVAQVETFCLD